MIIAALTFIGLLATLFSLGTIVASATIDTIGGAGSHLIDAVGGFASMFLWVGFALGAQNIEVVSNGEIVAVGANPTLFYLGVVMAASMLVVALLGTGWLIDIRDIYRGRERV